MRRMYGSTTPMEPSIFLREIDRDSLRIVGLPPRGFEVPGKGRGKKPTGKARSSDEYWQKGDKVYHDDYGYGEVREIRDSEDGPVVRVFFEHGGEVRFLSNHQGRNFTRIRGE